MFENFQKAVRDAYLRQKNNHQLDFSREWPSPGNLRRWCLKCYRGGLSKEDQEVFVNFFDYFRRHDSLDSCIRNFDLDKFKPLRNFIAGTTLRRPDENLVKLLAVLVDLRPRPYRRQDWTEEGPVRPEIASTDHTLAPISVLNTSTLSCRA